MSKKLDVMVVDDHPVFREGLRSYLKDYSIIAEIHIARDGQEAIEILEELQVDLIFMDICMPRMNGIEATKRIKQKHHHIKIIGMSVYDDHNSINKMLQAGASGYITKYASQEEIMNACQHVRDGKRYFSQDIMNGIYDPENYHVAASKAVDMVEPLTKKEEEIIKLILLGYTSKTISEKLGITQKTVETHRCHIYEKLKISHLVELFYFALDTGLINSPAVNLFWMAFLMDSAMNLLDPVQEFFIIIF